MKGGGIIWCFANKKELRRVRPEDQAGFTSLWEEIHETYRRTGPLCEGCMFGGPGPQTLTYAGSTRGARDVTLSWRKHVDSVVLTAQWLNMLLLHFKLSSPEPFEVEDLVVETGSFGLQVGKRSFGHHFQRRLVGAQKNVTAHASPKPSSSAMPTWTWWWMHGPTDPTGVPKGPSGRRRLLGVRQK